MYYSAHQHDYFHFLSQALRTFLFPPQVHVFGVTDLLQVYSFLMGGGDCEGVGDEKRPKTVDS